MSVVDLGVMEFDHVERINNADIINLVSWIDTGIRQFSSAPSHTTTEVLAQDIDIAEAWLANFKRNFTHFASAPGLYMPKASPKPKAVPLPPENVKIVQNPFLQMLMYQLSHLRTELLYCESSERLNGFQEQQKNVVVDPWIAKQENYIAEAKNALSTPEQTFMPEVNTQVEGNASNPR